MRGTPPFPAPAGMKWIYFMYFRHWISKEIIRRKNGKPFAVLVRS
jgi:3-methyladenine DNA glycosylase Mpg